MKKTFKTIAMLALVVGSTKAIAQNTAINSTGTAPDASAMLDVSSTTKGFLPPRMTSAQRAAISSPASGLVVYQTDGSVGLYYYNGASWSMLSSAVSYSFLTKSADYTITSSDVAGELIIAVSSAAVVTFTLPSATTVGVGKKIKLTTDNLSQQNNINVVISGGDTMIGTYAPAGTTNYHTGSTYYPNTIQLVSNGTGVWYITDVY